MSAEIFNKTRRILFSTANNPTKGFATAYEWMEKTYKKNLGPKGYAGLMAELKFYERFGKEYMLTIAGDMGEHADFSGMYDKEITRFDVTTNISFKDFKDYEPYMGDGIKYKIALCDKNNFEVIDVLELGFNKCNCGGYLIPFILLRDQHYNSKGESTWSNDQSLMQICTECSEFSELNSWTHHFLYSPSEFASGLPDDIDFNEQTKAVETYCVEHYKYFRREFREDIMAVAEHTYKITGRKGEGYWTFDFGFKNKAVAEEIPTDVDTGLI